MFDFSSSALLRFCSGEASPLSRLNRASSRNKETALSPSTPPSPIHARSTAIDISHEQALRAILPIDTNGVNPDA